MDLIRAKTDKSMQMAMRQLDGRTFKVNSEFTTRNLRTLAQVEVNIDYPEYDDVEEMTLQPVAREDAASLTRHSRIAKHGKPKAKFCVTA